MSGFIVFIKCGKFQPISLPLFLPFSSGSNQTYCILGCGKLAHRSLMLCYFRLFLSVLFYIASSAMYSGLEIFLFFSMKSAINLVLI